MTKVELQAMLPLPGVEIPVNYLCINTDWMNVTASTMFYEAFITKKKKQQF